VHNGTDAHTLTARVDGNDRIPAALSALVSAGVGVAELTLGQPSLDDVFFALTGKSSEPSKVETLA
jgi:ABC-2 type transport system ATP-binding protein